MRGPGQLPPQNPFKEFDDIDACKDESIIETVHNLEECSEDFYKCEEIDKYRK